MKFYPLHCQAIYKTHIWGGQTLNKVFGKPLPAGRNIGESWELSDMPEDKTVVENGPLAGQTISELLSNYSNQIMDYPYTGIFPLLVKFLDAQQDLSVQVHPDAETCKRLGKGDPKAECLYILHAEPGAAIYKGFRPGVTQELFRKAVREGTCHHLLERVQVRAGQCHFLPAGVCHAIGAGLLIAEVQQPSDTTYRLFDWNRIDAATGKPRKLHLEEAVESVRFDIPAEQLQVKSDGRLVDVPEFCLDKGHHVTGGECLFLPGKMKVVIILKGKGSWQGRDFATTPYSAGDTFLIPAAMEGLMRFETETEYLIASIPRG